MRSIPALLGPLLLAGCSVPQGPFQLSDVEQLKVGESTREQVESRLGKSEYWSARSAIHRGGKATAIPDAPLSFIFWPIYRGWQGQRTIVTVWYDDRNILTEGTLTLESESLDECLLIFSIRSVAFSFEEELLEPLRRIELNGFKIQVGEGDRILSLKAFLDRRPP